MAKLVLKSGRLSVKEASSDPAVNAAYREELDRHRRWAAARKLRKEQEAKRQRYQRRLELRAAWNTLRR